MGRPRRSDLTNPFLHVWTRGVDRQDIFSSDQDRRVLEQLLAETVERFGIDVHAYAFMHNHVHFMIDRRDGDVSAAFRFALAQYASYYNARTERTGPLFAGRFGATEIEDDEQALQCSRYIHLNPLAFVPRNAVTSYRWSSLGVYAERRAAPDWLTTTFIPDIRHRSAASYVSYVLRPQPGDRDGRPVRPWDRLDLNDVDDVVAGVVGERPGRVGQRGRLNDAASIAIAAAMELRVGTSPEIAAHHGLSAPVSARTAARRARARAIDDRVFAAALSTVTNLLRSASVVDRAAEPGIGLGTLWPRPRTFWVGNGWAPSPNVLSG